MHESDFDEGQDVESKANVCKEELHECPNMKV